MTSIDARTAVHADFRERGLVPLSPADLDRWIDDAMAHLSRWAREDGVTVDQVEAGSAAASLTGFYHMVTAVGIAQRPEFLKPALAAAKKLADLQGDAATDAERRALANFRAAIWNKKRRMPSADVELVAQTMANIMRKRVVILLLQKA